MAEKRMISKRLSQSRKVNSLSMPAALLWTWCIPWFDVDGYLEVDADALKYNVLPRRKDISEDDIPGLVREIAGSGLWKLYTYQGKTVAREIKFNDIQQVRKDKEGKSTIIPGELREYSGSRPDEVIIKEVIRNEVKLKESKLKEPEPENDHDALLEKTEETEEQRARFSQAFTAKTNRLRSKYPRFNPQLFFQNHLNGHRDAILLCLDRLIEANPPISNPRSYCEKVIGIESGNFYEADAIKKHEAIKKSGPQSIGECLQGAIKNAMSREVP